MVTVFVIRTGSVAASGIFPSTAGDEADGGAGETVLVPGSAARAPKASTNEPSIKPVERIFFINCCCIAIGGMKIAGIKTCASGNVKKLWSRIKLDNGENAVNIDGNGRENEGNPFANGANRFRRPNPRYL